jgi:hypothetical protein
MQQQPTSPVDETLIPPLQATATAPVGGTSKPKGDDYVYFERDSSVFTSEAAARATAAKLKLESFYKVAVDSAIERNARYA